MRKSLAKPRIYDALGRKILGVFAVLWVMIAPLPLSLKKARLMDALFDLIKGMATACLLGTVVAVLMYYLWRD